MALTDKGKSALAHIKTHFPSGSFSAKDLSDACGEKIVAATLNAVANNGYLNKFLFITFTLCIWFNAIAFSNPLRDASDESTDKIFAPFILDRG